MDIRILVPKFGAINARKHNLHEVVRLSNVDIQIGDELQTISVKVTSIPGIRLQVYFIDNEQYFGRKFIFRDQASEFFEDNPERLIFICRGVLETIKNLNWIPDIVHCHDWITSLIPFYLKKSAETNPALENIKVIFNVYNTIFPEKFHENFTQTAGIQDISNGDTIGFHELIQLGTQYADVVAHSETALDFSKFTTDLQKNILHINADDEGIDQYYKIYQNLSNPL